MPALNPPWTVYPDTEDAVCECGHQGEKHALLDDIYPCGEEEHFDVQDGRMTLVDEPCPCENYAPG